MFYYHFKSKKAEIGEIRNRSSGKYKKIAEGKWVKISENESNTNENYIQEDVVEYLTINDIIELEQYTPICWPTSTILYTSIIYI